MKKKIILTGLAVLLAFSASAQVKLKDVPDDHWAASAVYDLVKLGVTKGYPDGTFRGNKPITRYETALFLSKLAKAIGGDNVKADIKELKDQVLELKKGPQGLSFAGSYLGDWKVGNLLSTVGGVRGSVGSYRLIVSAGRELGEGAGVKINLDTMDYGYFDDGTAATAGRGLLASELFDIESNVKLNLAELPVDLKLTYGPGPKQHLADPTGALSSEVGVVYVRPNTGVKVSTTFSGADVYLGYYSLQGANLNLSGKVNTSQLTGSIAFNLPALLSSVKLALTGDYVAQGLLSSTNKDLRGKVDLSTPLHEKVQASGTVGFAGTRTSDTMVSGALAVNDLWDTGTVVTIRAAKIGSSYITPDFASEEFYFAGYDYFNRPLIGGTVQVGGVLTQTVSDKVRLVGKGDVRLSGDYKYQGSNARLTAEGGISYDLAPSTNFGAAYRVHQDRGTGDTSDLAQVGLMYRF